LPGFAPVGHVKGERPDGETAPVSALETASPIIWPPYQITLIAIRRAESDSEKATPMQNWIWMWFKAVWFKATYHDCR
jgi:hypothetical protein